MKKNYTIELLRFLFACMIVYFHILHSNIMKYTGESTTYLTMQATNYLCSYIVECFLIISGYFLYLSVIKDRKKTFIEFLLDKFVRLWPVFAVQTSAMVLFFDMKLQEAFFDFFFLRATGLISAYRGIVWYIGPFFYVTLLIFVILKYFSKKSALLAISLIAYISYAINLNIFDGMLGREVVMGFVSAAMLRVLGGICLGVLIAAAMDEYHNVFGFSSGAERKVIQMLISVLEITVAAVLFRLFLFYDKPISSVIIVIILFAILFVCIISEQGVFSTLLNRKIFGIMGKYSYSIYVMQQFTFNVLSKTFWHNKDFVYNHPYLTVFISVIACVVSGVIIYHLVERPAVGLYKKWKVYRKAREKQDYNLV